MNHDSGLEGTSTNDNLSSKVTSTEVFPSEEQSSNSTTTSFAHLGPDIQEKVKNIIEWLALQDYIVEPIRDVFIVAFLHSCFYDIQATRSCIIKYAEVRAALPEILNFKHDPLLKNDKMKLILENYNVSPMIHKDGEMAIVYARCKNSSAHVYDFDEYHRLLFMITEMLIAENPTRKGYIYVFDANNLGFGQFQKVNLTSLKTLLSYYQEGLPLKIRDVHHVNMSFFGNFVFNIVTPWLGAKLKERLHFYKHSEMSKFIAALGPANIPCDYGGTGPSLDSLHNAAISKLRSLSS